MAIPINVTVVVIINSIAVIIKVPTPIIRAALEESEVRHVKALRALLQNGSPKSTVKT